MTIYLASPNTQQQAQAVSGMPVLISFAIYSPWLMQYQPTFSRLLIDSGAFSEMNSGTTINVDEYAEWCDQWVGHADAIAGLDDISGDWKRSLKNYEKVGFPTFHDTDPDELLPELIELSRSRGNWIGIGLKPPRSSKADWIRKTIEQIPDDIHIHGWALRAYSNIRRFDSFDSTNWWRDAMDYRKSFPWLTYGETLDIVVKRYLREPRHIGCRDKTSSQKFLF